MAAETPSFISISNYPHPDSRLLIAAPSSSSDLFCGTTYKNPRAITNITDCCRGKVIHTGDICPEDSFLSSMYSFSYVSNYCLYWIQIQHLLSTTSDIIIKNARKFEFNISTSLKQMKVNTCWIEKNLPGIYHLYP